MRGDLDDNFDLPRDTTGRNVLVVLLVAALAFGVTFAIARLRQGTAAPTAPPAVLVPPPAPAAIAPPPAVRPPPAPEAKAAAAVAKPAMQSPKGLGGAAPAAAKTARPGAYPSSPPAHLKGELLPLSP
jgi:hypothetical protein